MANDQDKRGQEWWAKALVSGDPMARWLRRVMRHTPSSPRCAMCYAPFAGVGGRVVKLAGFGPSRKNPRWCSRCFEEAPLGGVEIEVAVLFADVRGYTTLAETAAPEELARLLNRFYAVATDVLSRHDAVIDKLVGDQVMALFVPGLASRGHKTECIEATLELLAALGYGAEGEPWLPLGIGLDVGNAFVGNVGSGDVKDFTALGDVVNTAARLQSHAAAGQIVMSERFYREVKDRVDAGRAVSLELKGKSEPVAARVVELAARRPAA